MYGVIWIFLLFVDKVETVFVSDVSCPSEDSRLEDGTATLTAVLGGGVNGDMVTSVFSISGNTSCDSHVIEQTLRINGCFKPETPLVVDIYISIGTESLIVVQISCDAYESDREPETSKALIKEESDTWDLFVTTESQQNFSRKEEVHLVCNPLDSEVLYLRNPDPAAYHTVIAYTEHNKELCRATFVNNMIFVEVDQCSLDDPVVVAFTKRRESSVAGDSLKVFRIDCLSQELYQDLYHNIPMDDSIMMSLDFSLVAMVTALTIFGIV